MREASELSPGDPAVARPNRRWAWHVALCGTALMAAAATVATLRAFEGAGTTLEGTAGPKPAPTLYGLRSAWTTDAGRGLRLADLSGHFQVVALMFTRCPSACPTLVRELQEAEKAMPRALRDRTRFVLVSIDPEHDTPQVLNAYRRRMHLAGDRWTLLAGSADDVRELSAILGFNFAKDQSEGFAHSRLVTLLDPTGHIIHQQTGMAEDRQRFLNALHRGVAREARL